MSGGRSANPSGLRAKLRDYWMLSRPFTLLPPLVGMLSGSVAAVGALDGDGRYDSMAGHLVLGALMAATLNAASNVLNQIYDLEIDRINKPSRPLAAGRINLESAGRFAVGLYLAALGLAGLVRPAGTPELAIIVVITAVITWAYSAPPLRLRNSWWAGPLAIAIPRGGLLKVAGWACVAPVFSDREPWVLGGVFFLFVLGCAPIKDFGDMEGDRAQGASSLPIRFGVRRAARLMAPFYLLPWIAVIVLPLIVIGGRPLLGIPSSFALLAGALLLGTATVAVGRLLRSVGRGATVGPTQWKLLYLLMMEAQLLLAIGYLL